MKRIAVFIFCIINFYLLYFYLIDIVKYFSGKYNYDGWHYLIPLTIADVSFFICLIFIFFSIGLNKYFLGYAILAVAHNAAVGAGIEYFPFVGFAIVILTMVYIFRFDNWKPSA